MANKLRSALKVIKGEMNKHRLFNNATSVIGNATERAQEKLNNMQSVVNLKYDTIVKQINNETAIIQNLNAAQLEKRDQLPKIISKYWNWYQELTGMDKVELCRQNVILAQDKLFKCQDDRRQLNRHAAIINDRLKEVYGELVQTKRDDPRYVQLTIVENKSLQDQAKVTAQLNLLEKDERDHFTLLATAIKEYHDSQAVNAQKYKYLSILASAAIAIVSLIGSMIYNNKRIRDVRNVVEEAQKRNETVMVNGFRSLENQIVSEYFEALKKIEAKLGPSKEHMSYGEPNSEEENTLQNKLYSLFSNKVAIGIVCFCLLKFIGL